MHLFRKNIADDFTSVNNRYEPSFYQSQIIKNPEAYENYMKSNPITSGMRHPYEQNNKRNYMTIDNEMTLKDLK